jgi:hypothetical protein
MTAAAATPSPMTTDKAMVRAPPPPPEWCTTGPRQAVRGPTGRPFGHGGTVGLGVDAVAAAGAAPMTAKPSTTAVTAASRVITDRRR